MSAPEANRYDFINEEVAKREFLNWFYTEDQLLDFCDFIRAHTGPDKASRHDRNRGYHSSVGKEANKLRDALLLNRDTAVPKVKPEDINFSISPILDFLHLLLFGRYGCEKRLFMDGMKSNYRVVIDQTDRVKQMVFEWNEKPQDQKKETSQPKPEVSVAEDQKVNSEVAMVKPKPENSLSNIWTVHKKKLGPVKISRHAFERFCERYIFDKGRGIDISKLTHLEAMELFHQSFQRSVKHQLPKYAAFRRALNNKGKEAEYFVDRQFELRFVVSKDEPRTILTAEPSAGKKYDGRQAKMPDWYQRYKQNQQNP